MDTEIEVRKMECKEIRVDVRTASIKESTEGQRQTKILFQINHTMPFTDEYNHLLKELFGNNLGDGSMISWTSVLFRNSEERSQSDENRAGASG